MSANKNWQRALVATTVALLLLSTPVFAPGGWDAVYAKRTRSVTEEVLHLSPGAEIYNRALSVFNQADKVHYEHKAAEASSQVTFHGKSCDAECDCSGFVSYILQAITPKQYEFFMAFANRSGHPQAKNFVQFFATLNPNEPQGGWLGVKSFGELGCGDLIAWRKAVTAENAAGASKKGNTGHVMIVEAPPSSVQSLSVNDGDVRFIEIPVIDSSSVDHFPPEQLPPLAHQQHRDGVGRGVVRLILDEQNHVVGYWEGTYWNEGGKQITKPSFTDGIVFARLLREKPGSTTSFDSKPN